MMNLELNPIIAAVRTKADFVAAAASPVEVIFLLQSNILTLQETVNYAHSKEKQLFVHVDFTEGLGKDKTGLQFIRHLGADGIISTRTNLVRLAHECGLASVQRFFIIDSHSVDTAVESIQSSKPDTIEIMPGILPRIITSFKGKVKMPIIAGGLIETKSDIMDAINAGAHAVSTAKNELWLA